MISNLVEKNCDAIWLQDLLLLSHGKKDLSLSAETACQELGSSITNNITAPQY